MLVTNTSPGNPSASPLSSVIAAGHQTMTVVTARSIRSAVWCPRCSNLQPAFMVRQLRLEAAPGRTGGSP